ncbi:MAG: ferredoxin FdxA [Gammaproteobacteria bacterium]
MTFVVTESCIRCRYGDCMKVCPVDCFHGGPNMVVIDPAACIDCAKCAPECPANAIYPLAEVPDDQQPFVALNAELSRIWAIVTAVDAPLPEAGKWKRARGKLQYLER